MRDQAEKRGQLIRHLEEAIELADEIEDGQTGYLIERALDEAQSRQFRLIDYGSTIRSGRHGVLVRASRHVPCGQDRP
jgi:hypothetical protein